jgi:hypothetical protein
MRKLLYPELQKQTEFVVVRTPAQRKAREKAKGDASALLGKALRDAQQLLLAMKQKGVTVDYTAVGPSAVIGFFCMTHSLVYGVEPAELRDRNNYMGAISGIRRLLQQEFNGDIAQVFEFVRWTWQREKRQFQTRQGDFRVGWRYQFCSKALLTDYRIAFVKQVKIG